MKFSVVVALVLSLVGCSSGSPAVPVPVIENITQPNSKCSPAKDRKLTLNDDLSKIQWFGWVDGRQVDMPISQAMAMKIQGHEVRDAWYCPPRADW